MPTTTYPSYYLLQSIRRIIFAPLDLEQIKQLNSKQDTLCQYLTLAFSKYFEYHKINNIDDQIRFVEKILMWKKNYSLYPIDIVIAFLSEEVVENKKNSPKHPSTKVIENLKHKIVFLNDCYEDLDKNMLSLQKMPLLTDLEKEFNFFCSTFNSAPTPSYKVDKFSFSESRSIDRLIDYISRSYRIIDVGDVIKNLLLQQKRNGTIADGFFCDRTIKESVKIKKIKECWFTSDFFRSEFLKKNQKNFQQFFLKNLSTPKDHEDFKEYCYYKFVNHSLSGRVINSKLSEQLISSFLQSFYCLERNDLKKLLAGNDIEQSKKNSPRKLFYKTYDEVNKLFGAKGDENLLTNARRERLYKDYFYFRYFKCKNINLKQFIYQDFERRKKETSQSTMSPTAQSLSLVLRRR